MNIQIVGTHEIDAVWPLIADGFVEVTKRCGDDQTSGELWQMVRSGGAFLVVVLNENAIRVSTVVQFQRWADGPVLRIMSMTGAGLSEWGVPLKDYLSEMARKGGASRIVAEGREGWARIFDEPRKLRSTYVMSIK